MEREKGKDKMRDRKGMIEKGRDRTKDRKRKIEKEEDRKGERELILSVTKI